MSTDATMPPMSKAYDPSEHESRVWQKWIEANAFHADPDRVLRGEARPYCVLIPPPNVTAALHLGHALNNSIQDILVRAHRMKGYETLWMPGTDHAGIATQTMVDRRLKEQGKDGIGEYKKKELAGGNGREEFIGLVQEFKDEFEARITDQLQKMGCSCDWQRQRFTMDDICARAVREAFFRLFRDGLIYRGKRLVNWDPVTQTALADDEVEMEEVDGFFWYMKYPVVDDTGNDTGEFVTVATTRPETFFGDTAVAVNPNDAERAAFIGKRVRVPFVNRIIPVIGDDYVVPPDPESSDSKAKFATGFLKVTPAHDPNDYAIGQRHNLDIINVMAPDASISDQHGWEDVGEAQRFLGLSREDARVAVEQAFRDANLLADKKSYSHSVGHSYRSHVPVEPYLSDQWYCKVTDDKLRGNAQRALKLSQRTDSSLTEWPESRPRRVQANEDSGKQWIFELYFETDDYRVEVVERYTSHLSAMIEAYGITSSITTQQSDEKIICQSTDQSAFAAMDEIFDVILESRAGWQNLQAAKTLGDDWVWMDNHTYGLGSDSGPIDLGNRFVSGDSMMTFYPARYAKTYETWHDNLRDWCISRQLWWGHRIPVWHIQTQIDCSETELQSAIDSLAETQDCLGDLSVKLLVDHEIHSLRVFGICFNSPNAESMMNHVALMISTGAMKASSEPIKPEDTLNRSDLFGTGSLQEVLAVRRLILSMQQDPDVLDTWFSSALWPLSTMGWPDASAAKDGSGIEDFESLLPAFNPTSVLTTAREIITLWVSRMVMFNRYFLSGAGGTGVSPVQSQEHQGEHRRDTCATGGRTAWGPAPFKDVFIHAMIQDGEGRKMSKSLGNGVDPLDIIDSHGADAMRFTLCQMTTQTQDVRMPVELDESTGKNTSPKFDLGRNLCNKLWNASKFALGMFEKAELKPGLPINPEELTLIDRWMLSRVTHATNKVNTALRNYMFKDYADAIYDLFWRDFCDWYLESIKPTIGGNPEQAAVLRTVLDAILRLMHPVMPFITETLFERFESLPMREIEGFGFEVTKGTASLCQSGWPTPDDELRDEVAEEAYERVRSLVTTIREVRATAQVKPKRQITLHAGGELAADINRWSPLVETLAGVEAITADKPEGQSASFTFEGNEYRLSNLADALDAGAERDRLEKELATLAKSIAGINGRLSNPGYVDKAPAHLVEQTRAQLAQLEKDHAATKAALDKLA